MTELLHTPLHAWHLEHGGRLGAFAGYDMPIRYEPGTIAEHLHTRQAAGLFDVSHMGVADLSATGFADVAAALESLVPCDVAGLQPGRQRYTQLLAHDGGIIDDLMISRLRGSDGIRIVSNAGRKDVVFAIIASALAGRASLTVRPELALIALQGPMAETVLCSLSATVDAIASMRFMDVADIDIADHTISVSRSGYTGEDGFELAIPADAVLPIVEQIAASERVMPIGLGARDTLRLEAGLCLYGHDIDETTTPVEANLTWSIQKRRRSEGGFPGAPTIASQIAEGPARRLVGLVPQGRSIVRDNTPLFGAIDDKEPIGIVTSGGYAPTLGHPIALGYVPVSLAAPTSSVWVDIRGTRTPVAVTATPFVAHTYRR